MGGLNLAAGLLPGALTAAQTFKDVRQYQAEQEYQKAKYQQQEQKNQREYQEQLARQQYELQKQAIEAQNDRTKAFIDQQKAQQAAVKEQNRLNAEIAQQQAATRQRETNRTNLAYSKQQDFSHLIQRQDADFIAAQQDATSRRQQIDLDAATTEAARQAALRRAVARQRATFGARGISPDSGSAEAVLLGLYHESEDDRIQREKLDRMRQNALTDDLNQKRQRNLLERTQLAEAQKLQLLSYFG